VSIAISEGKFIFFRPGVAVNYKVSRSDPDGSEIDKANIFCFCRLLEAWMRNSLFFGAQESVLRPFTGKA